MYDLCMNTFRKVYNSDLMRYKGHPGGYVRVFLFLLRKAQYSSSLSKQFWKILFRLHSQSRGIEISPLTKIGRGFYMGHAYNITINPSAVIGDNCNIHKGVLIGQTNRGGA